MNKRLITAARCALADLLGLQENGDLEGNEAAKKTIVELYLALQEYENVETTQQLQLAD